MQGNAPRGEEELPLLCECEKTRPKGGRPPLVATRDECMQPVIEREEGVPPCHLCHCERRYKKKKKRDCAYWYACSIPSPHPFCHVCSHGGPWRGSSVSFSSLLASCHCRPVIVVLDSLLSVSASEAARRCEVACGCCVTIAVINLISN